MSRDAVSRTANAERNGGQSWVSRNKNPHMRALPRVQALVNLERVCAGQLFAARLAGVEQPRLVLPLVLHQPPCVFKKFISF